MSTTFQQYWLPEKKRFDSLQLRDVPKESPKLGQILVRIKAVPSNWRDGIVAIGTYPFPRPDALVPGSDGAGVVEEVGEGVTEWKVGNRSTSGLGVWIFTGTWFKLIKSGSEKYWATAG